MKIIMWKMRSKSVEHKVKSLILNVKRNRVQVQGENQEYEGQEDYNQVQEQVENQEYEVEDQVYKNHQEEEKNQGDVTDGHHEEKGDDLAPNVDRKIPIGVNELIWDFDPRKPVFRKLTEIIHCHFNGPWHCILVVPAEVKTLWNTEFQAIANRGSKRSVENGNYHGGLRKVLKWMKVMAKESGVKPLIFEVVRKLWSKNKEGVDLGTATKTAIAFIADCPPAQPIPMNQQIMMWLKASKGLPNGRIFSFGEFGVRLVRSGLIDDLTDESFSSRLTQESVDPM